MRNTALQNVRLQPSRCWGHTEYSLEYHREYFHRRTGVRPGDDGFTRAIYDDWRVDFLWSVDNGLRSDWGALGRATDMGHAVYASDESDKRAPRVSPFESADEVWAFDAVGEYGLPTMEEQVRDYETKVAAARVRRPGQLTTGGYYPTIVSGGIAAFGWDMLLLAAAEPAKMERVWDGFYRRTLFHMEAWARTTVDVIIQHDDFVWSSGAFMHPRIYRDVILPRYAALWKPLKAAGKSVLFCSDGDFTEFTTDLADAGADGFIFEPMVDFGYMADTFGSTHCLVGSYVDCRDMTFGNWDKVRADIDRTLLKLERCRGAVVAVGNHLPANIPEPMMDRYIEYLAPRLEKGAAVSSSS